MLLNNKQQVPFLLYQSKSNFRMHTFFSEISKQPSAILNKQKATNNKKKSLEKIEKQKQNSNNLQTFLSMVEKQFQRLVFQHNKQKSQLLEQISKLKAKLKQKQSEISAFTITKSRSLSMKKNNDTTNQKNILNFDNTLHSVESFLNNQNNKIDSSANKKHMRNKSNSFSTCFNSILGQQFGLISHLSTKTSNNNQYKNNKNQKSFATSDQQSSTLIELNNALLGEKERLSKGKRFNRNRNVGILQVSDGQTGMNEKNNSFISGKNQIDRVQRLKEYQQGVLFNKRAIINRPEQQQNQQQSFQGQNSRKSNYSKAQIPQNFQSQSNSDQKPVVNRQKKKFIQQFLNISYVQQRQNSFMSDSLSLTKTTNKKQESNKQNQNNVQNSNSLGNRKVNAGSTNQIHKVLQNLRQSMKINVQRQSSLQPIVMMKKTL